MSEMGIGMECGGFRKKGLRFASSDELLVKFLVDKVKYGIEHEGVFIREHDLYGNKA